jgi:hypothetical protein
MAGSIGELTALVRLARSLPKGLFRISYAEFVRSGWDPHPRVDGLLRSLKGFALLEMERGPSGVEVRQGPLGGDPDVIVLSSFRAFFQYPKFPKLIQRLLALWATRGIRVITLDPCGDSFLCPIPSGVSVIVPRPFTYSLAQREGQVLYSAGTCLPRHRRHHRWLWAAAPWMQDCHRFRAAERLAFLGLSELGIEVSVLSPLDPALPFLRQARVIDDSLGYTALEAEVARHDLLISANCRSVLGARAAAMGVPLALVDPAKLPCPGGYDSTTEDMLRAAADEQDQPAPVPVEWREVPCGRPDETVASFVALQQGLGEMRERQLARCLEYQHLPSPEACIEQVLAPGVH